jgi:biopolymer transport protein ExbB
MILSALEIRKEGYQATKDMMKNEGKRHTATFWHRLALLNDIAIIAPMLGLLGTVMGMFYAFYDINRSFESISSLFDGLGIAVGTTVLGLIVAIIAMILYTTLKYRMMKIFSQVEHEAAPLTRLIEYGTTTRRRTKA